MTAADPVNLATLLVTLGATGFAVAAAAWAYRLTVGGRAAQSLWRARLSEAEDRRIDAVSLFSAYPGLVLVWTDPPKADDADWGAPRMIGAPGALTAMLSVIERGDKPGRIDAAAALLDGLCDQPAAAPSGQEATLRAALGGLMGQGKPFTLAITGPSGRVIEADGRTAGVQLVLWLSEPAMKGVEAEPPTGRTGEAERLGLPDPFAFLDMASRAPFPVWRMSSAGKLDWANSAYVDAVEGESLAKTLSRQAVLDPGLVDLARAALREGAVKTQVRGAIVKGARRELEFVVYPIPGGAAGAALDATERSEALTALSRLRQAHNDTLNHLAEAVAVFGADQRLMFYNRAFAALFRLDEAALNERPAHGALLDRLRERRLLPEQADYAAWKAEALADYERPATEEIPDALWALPDGRTLRFARQRHPLGGLLLIFEDKTDQLALQAQYNTLIKVQRATLDKLHEAVAVFGPDGRLRLRNAAFEALWRLPAETPADAAFDVLAQAGLRLFPDAEAWRDLKARITDPTPEARQPVTGEIRRSDEKILTYLTRPLPDGATLIAWDDVTDSRRIEGALRERAEALEASERVKTDFVKHVSYQLRTPLTTIQGYADLLSGGLAGDLSERQGEHLETIRTAAGQLAKMIDDILDVAAIDAGALELELGEADLSALIEETAGLLASRAERAGVKLALALDEAAPVEADPARIKQVLYNLVSNSLDHCQDGGRIEIGAAVEGETAKLWVIDDGEGIAPDRQAKIFERFERGQGGGAGLGLALVNEIIRLHGGWVALESAPGEGARIVCHLPVAAADQEPLRQAG